jgi:hypothetical protein
MQPIKMVQDVIVRAAKQSGFPVPMHHPGKKQAAGFVASLLATPRKATGFRHGRAAARSVFVKRSAKRVFVPDVAAIRGSPSFCVLKTWMPGTGPGMTK